MRVFVVLCAVLLGCTYETNNYCGDGLADGGVGDMPGYTDEFGTYHETEPNQGIFRSDSKLQGQAQLTLAPAPAMVPLPAWIPRFPLIREDSPAMAMGQTLIDLGTKDGQPHVVTLSFGKTVPSPIAAVGPWTEAVAVINLGIGGAAYYAEVDIIEGVQFSLAVNRLQVHVVYRVPPGGGAVPVPVPTADIGASASSDVIAHGRQPQRTYTHAGSLMVPAIAAGVGTNDGPWIIPPFAKAVRVVPTPVNAQVNLVFMTLTGINVPAIYPVVAPATQEYPIPSSAYMVNVQNMHAVNSVYAYNLIFELAL